MTAIALFSNVEVYLIIGKKGMITAAQNNRRVSNVGIPGINLAIIIIAIIGLLNNSHPRSLEFERSGNFNGIKEVNRKDKV